MERNKAAQLANLLVTYRPGWNVRDTTDELEQLTGAGDAAIAYYAISLILDPETRYPARLGLRWNPAEATPTNNNNGTSRRPGNQTPCDICGRSEWGCNKAAQNTGHRDHVYAPHVMTQYDTDKAKGLHRLLDDPPDPDIPAALGELGPKRLAR